MRITQEGHHVEDHQEVYEILWSYINPEVSVAEPSKTIAMKVPIGYNMWYHRCYCQAECKERNKKFMNEKPKQNFYYV